MQRTRKRQRKVFFPIPLCAVTGASPERKGKRIEK